MDNDFLFIYATANSDELYFARDYCSIETPMNNGFYRIKVDTNELEKNIEILNPLSRHEFLSF